MGNLNAAKSIYLCLTVPTTDTEFNGNDWQLLLTGKVCIAKLAVVKPG